MRRDEAESSVVQLSRGGDGTAPTVNRFRDGNMDMVTVDQRLHILMASSSVSGEDDDDDRKEDQPPEDDALEVEDDEEATQVGQDEEINHSPPIVVVTSSRAGDQIREPSSVPRFREPSLGGGGRPKSSSSPTDLLQMIMEMDTVAEANFRMFLFRFFFGKSFLSYH